MTSEDFEKQVQRIVSILEEEATVTWNERIVDPDNPDQLRQIDVSIRRDNEFCLVECRMHQRPQDVQWIEELHGRKISLNANSAMAVSSSGFTEGALLKAKRFGVFTRDLRQLTDEEIRSWGRAVKVTMSYVHYDKVDIYCIASPLAISFNVHSLTAFKTSLGAAWPLDKVFRRTADLIAKHALSDKELVRVSFLTKDLFIGSTPIPQLIFQARWRWLHKEVALPTVLVFGESKVHSPESEVHIERAQGSRTEIHHGSGGVAVWIDIASCHPGGGAFFCEALLDMGEPVRLTGLGVIGLAEPILAAIPFKVHRVVANTLKHKHLQRDTTHGIGSS